MVDDMNDTQIKDVDGILECNDMKLKKDVAQAYVPVEIRKGHISSCRIRCDWNALLSHPIEIEINGVHIECTSIEKKKSPEVSILSSIESQLLSQQSSHGYIDGWIKRMIQHVKITVNDVHITYVTPSPSSSPFTLGVALTSLVITSTSNNTKSCSIDGFTSYLIIGDVENESTTPMSFQQRLDEWSMISPAPSPSLLIASPAAASASLPPPFPYLLRPTSIHFNVSLQPRLSITSTLPDLMIETTEEQLQILITWIQHMMTSSTSHGRIGTVQDREKYIPLYQRTLSWKDPLTSEERETLTQLENDIRIQDLIRWRKQAFHQLQHAIAPHQVTRRGEYVDTITKGWQKLQHLSPWMAKLISTATSWGWSQTSSETPITDQQANELIQSLHLDEDVKNEDDKIELNITTKSFTFQIASNRGDLVTRLTIPSSSITYQHEISDTTPNTHINASTPNVMISLSQPRTNASLMDLTTVLTLELTQPIWDMKWSYDDTADVMTSRMTLTLVDITLSDWLQTNPHLRRVMYTRHDDDPLHDTLIGLEWKQIRVSSSPSQHVVTCNIHTLHTQYNPHTVKVMWETWRQLQIRLHMSRSPPSSPPQHDRQGSLTPRLTSQSIIPFHTPNMDLTFHLALQHFTLSLNKDTKLHPRRILSMDIHGVDVTTSFQPPMYIDVRLKKLRIISAMNRINDVDMITSDTSIQPCFHMKYTGTTNTDIQSSFYLRTGKYHMMYQHQWILELLDYTREAIINVLTPFTIPIPMPSRPADSTAAASPDPRTPTTKSPKLSPRTIASPGVASRSLLRCIPTGTGELLRVPSAGEVSRPGSPVLGSPRRHSVPTITSTSTPGSPVAGSPLQARRALRRPLHISTTDLNTDEHSIPTPQPIQPQQQPQKHITRFPKMNIEMDNVIVTIPGITDKSDALMITLGTCSIQEASDSTSQIQHMICSLGTTNADIHHTDGTTSSLFKNITFSLDIKHIIHQHHSHMDMIGTVSPCVITFTPSTLLTCVSLIEHHVASHIITSTPSSPHEMSHPRLYTLADEIIYKYGIDNIRPSRTYTSIDDVMSHHVHLKMSDITITASSHNDSITRLSLYDVVMDSSRDTDANITTTYRMNHIGLIYENGTISHQLISRDDIKQSQPHLTWEQIYVVCDENNESRISYVITCHGLHITIIPEIITSYMHYLPIHTTRMLISTLSTYIPSLIERTCDHHSLIVELYGCRIALYQSSAKDAHRIIISHDLNLQYESSLVQSSCTLSLHDVRITNHDDQHVDDTILFPVSISCDMARSLIGSSIASPLHLGSTSTSTRAQIGSPAIIQRPRSPTLPNTFALDSPFLATRARLASRPTHRTRVSTDYSPSVFASPGPAPGAGAGAGVGAGRWHHTMDFERGSTKPETDWTTHHTGQGQEPMQIDANVSITPIDIRITYQDIKTTAALVNIMYRLYATWNASNENETTSTSTSSITSFLANAPADQLTSSIHPQTTMTLSINLASLRTVLIDDCNNRFTPLLSFHISSSSCSLSVQSCTICLVASIPIEIAFYNTKHSQWRAILHPVTVACEARATSSTVTTIDGDEGETENKEKKEEGKEIGEKEKEKSKSRLPIAPFTISLITPSPVDIRLSHTFITTMIDTYQRWKHAWNVNQDVTPFIAYRIINDTGCNICFWTDEDAAMGHAKREIVVGGDATIIEDSVQHRSRTHTKQAGTQTLTLNLAFERTTTMDVLHRIHLEHVGRRAYPLVHVSNAALSANRVLEYVLVDITLIRGCRHITLSSPISLINQTHTPLRFELEAMTEATLENEQNQHQYAVLAHPERELSLPIHLQHWTALCITPQDTNAATYQRTSSITRETQDDITYHIQQLVATDVNGHRMYFHCQSRHEDVDVAVDDIQPEMIITSPTSKPISQTLPHTTLIITAPLQLSNMYPFALTFRLWYSNVAADPHAPTQRLTSPPDTTLLIEQTLTSSASCDVHHINGYASGSYWLQFRMEHFQEYSQYILLPTHVDTRMTRGDIINTSCNDMDGRTYSIVMRIHDPMIGARQLIWCADYWLLNHTDIDLMYAFGDESLMGSNAYTQRMVRVMENQRRTPNGTWDIPYLTTDRPAYSDVDGHVMSSPDTNEAPKGWSWNDTKWNVVIEPQRTDVDGWMYADEFTSHEWFPTSTSPSTSTCHVRRREWIRQAIKTKAPMLYCEGLDAAQRNASTQPMSLYVPSGPSSTLIQRSLTGMEENSWVSVLHPPSPSGISHRSDIGIHVATAPGKYSTTRVITFTPRYIIVNHSNIPLHIGQAGCNDIMMAIAAGQQQALHWDDATKADTGLIRINPDPTEWCDSAPFPIHSIGRLVVKCRHRDIASSIKIKEVQQLMLFAITIRMVDATLVISCELEDLSQPSYRIENKCGLPIQFRQVMNGEEKKEDQQKEEKKEIIETPQPDWFILDNDQSIPHAWDSYASSPPYSLELSLANAPPVYIKPDDMGAYTSISYGANREIIHIYVIVENATNVVRISRTVPMNRGIAFGRTKKSRDDPVRAMSELASQIRLHIPQLNMALIDDTHSTSSRAILSLHIHQLKMAWGMTKQAYKYEFQITCLQINHPIGKLPVIIAIGEKPIKRDDTTSSSTSPCLTFACSRQHGLTYRNHHIPVERYDYVNIEISTIVHVQLEQDGINTMAAYFASLSLDPSWSLPSSSDVSLITPLLQQTDHTLSAHEQQRRSLTHQPHDEIVCEYHVTEFRISPIQAQVTMSWDVTSTNSMSPLLRLFGGLQQTSTPQLLTFPALAFLHQTFTLSEFASMIPIHYNRTSSHVRLIGILPHAPSERFAVASYIDPHYIFGDLTQSMLKGVKPLTRVMSRTKLRVSTGTLPVAATATSISADENDTTTSSSGVDSPFQDLLKSTQQLGRGLISLIRAPVRMVQHGWAERVKTLLGTADRAQDAEEENVTSGTMKPPKPAGLTRVMTSTISFKDPMARIAV